MGREVTSSWNGPFSSPRYSVFVVFFGSQIGYPFGFVVGITRITSHISQVYLHLGMCLVDRLLPINGVQLPVAEFIYKQHHFSSLGFFFFSSLESCSSLLDGDQNRFFFPSFLTFNAYFSGQRTLRFLIQLFLITPSRFSALPSSICTSQVVCLFCSQSIQTPTPGGGSSQKSKLKESRDCWD